MSATQTRIVQISDTHLFDDKEKSLLGVKTYDSLIALLDLLKKDPLPPDLILLTGDLSQDFSEKSYLNLVDLFDEFSVPVYCLAGNHDNSQLMDRLFPKGRILGLKNIVLNDWQLILLNSQKPGGVEGCLDDAQFDFMEMCLQRYPKHHAIISFHHQPVLVGSEWLDNLGLKNADVLWEKLKKYPQVKHILFGHIHQEYVGQKNGVQLYSTPSTCIQFKPKSAEFALDPLPPAYRWIDLKANGELETAVVHCEHYIGEFDASATGY